MKTKLLILCICCILLFGSGCGTKSADYVDGTYTGKSAVFQTDDGTEDGNGYGEIVIKIEGNQITECEFLTYEPDDKLKDSEYGKKNGEIANRDFYNKAQKSVAACGEYSKMIVENNGIEGVDSISGATINYNLLTDAAHAAFEKAEK